ncbi:hypothetical protein C7M84_000148 [Penaeus vannamei]|uniref:Methyltransferase domain-containing protein n=1 Tax=Penaeus vannamei TaxID=6689 RepID=A0A3R7QJU0_PENVA|nr:hypothetical protein C7M84_000148 [Penaeus vannamei]
MPALRNFSQFYEAVTTVEMGCDKPPLDLSHLLPPFLRASRPLPPPPSLPPSLSTSPTSSLPPRQVDRFENLVKDAGMEGKPIDVVKLDVELSEVDFMQDMLFNSRHVLRNVKQIAMEIHSDLTKDSVSQITSHQVFWPYLQLMRCAGFKIIFSRSGGRWREVVFAQDKQW